MKKICFVTPSLSNGGAERVVSILASELAILGYDVTIIKYYQEKTEYDINSKVKVINLCNGDQQVYKKWNIIKKIKSIRKIFKYEKYDYIIPFLTFVSFHIYLANKYLKSKIITTIRNNQKNEKKIMRVIMTYIIKKSYKVFVQNEDQKKYYRKKIQKKVCIIPNPISNSFIEDCKIYNTELKRIVCIGRLEGQKNYPLIIDSIYELFKEGYSNIQLEIYGKGSKYDELKTIILDYKANEYIKIKGFTKDIIGIYKKADIFILSSNFEGMPNCLMEAMAIGLPCISTDCPTGPNTLINNGKNGLLIKVGDKEEMKNAIKSYLNDVEYAIKLGKQAREDIINNYSPQKISKLFEREILNGGE